MAVPAAQHMARLELTSRALASLALPLLQVQMHHGWPAAPRLRVCAFLLQVPRFPVRDCQTEVGLNSYLEHVYKLVVKFHIGSKTSAQILLLARVSQGFLQVLLWEPHSAASISLSSDLYKPGVAP